MSLSFRRKHTWGNWTVPIVVAAVFGGFLTFISFCYLIYATISIMTGTRRGLPYLSWQIMFAIALWVKFFTITFFFEIVFQFHVARCNQTGPWFNIKMLSYQQRKSHCGDKTILRPSYIHNKVSYSGKTTSWYWIRVLGLNLITFK